MRLRLRLRGWQRLLVRLLLIARPIQPGNIYLYFRVERCLRRPLFSISKETAFPSPLTTPG
jgi:hypothetical protein